MSGAHAPAPDLRQETRTAAPAAQDRRRKILQISSYPPPRAGWAVRVWFLKQQLEADGHECVVLNIGTSRNIPSPEYETVMGGTDYVRKVWRFCSRGFLPHVHVNGNTMKGLVLSLIAQVISLIFRRRVILTFHGGIDQEFFPRHKAPRLVPVYRLLFALSRTIVCNNDAVKSRIMDYGVSGAKVVPIPAFSLQYLQRGAAMLPPEAEDFFTRFQHGLFSYIRYRPGFFLPELIAGFAVVAAARSDVGLLLCADPGHSDDNLPARIEEQIRASGLNGRVQVVGDLTHEQFLVTLSRSAFYVRTPVSDGVASSVLEALSLGTPVIASENGSRPAGVITYPATDAAELGRVLLDALDRRDAIVASLPRPAVRDTLSEEIELLAAATT
jgi:glycosyltransferase involved in cell wall biosynthesis